MQGPKGVDGRVGAGGDQVNHLGGALLKRRELRKGRLKRDGVGPPVGYDAEGAHPLGDGVAGLAGGVDDLVELQMRVTEVGADDIPVHLLTLDVQLDQVHQDALEVGGKLRRSLEVADFVITAAVVLRSCCASHDLCKQRR